MNEIQIKLTITADKAVIKLVESIVPIVEKITAACKVEVPNTLEAENTPSEPEKPVSAPQSAEDDDPGFDGTLPPVTVEDCIKAAKMAKDSGVPIDAIRATVARYGVSRPQDVPADKLGELFDALSALGAKK